MSDLHVSSRKMLTFNTGAFFISSLGFTILLITTLFSKGFGLSIIFFLLGYAAFGVYPFVSAWSAFKNMEYAKSKVRGLVSWIVPGLMAVMGLLG
ncbi:MAG: hypothetical protein EAZ55_05640 [Cytophagales bacterium]|nr:MAG: hypothetical protein EAZ55_05640 [Cytophagales bacterium]